MGGTGTSEGAEDSNRTAKSVNILICFKFLAPYSLQGRPVRALGDA